MKKVKNSFGGVIGGIILLIAGTCLLWWNEGNNVKNIATTNEVETTAIEIKSDKVEASNDDKLVVVSDNLNVIDEEIADTEFGVALKTAKLQRKVEVYQWEEDSSTDDDGDTTYSYHKEWHEGLIDSGNFHNKSHVNPTSVDYHSESYQANEVKLGAFNLSTKQIGMLSTNAKYNPSSLKLKEGYTYQGDYITSAKDLNKPEIGDIRISWSYNDWKEVTILAVQKGTTFTDFVSKNGKKVNRVEKGTLTIEGIVANMRSENNMMKWIFRGIGALLIVFGYISILGPISTLASFVPILGGLVGGLLSLVGFLVGIVHSLIIIILAWFRFRPVLSVVLIAVVVALIFSIRKLVKSKKAPEVPTTDAPVIPEASTVETTPEEVKTEQPIEENKD